MKCTCQECQGRGRIECPECAGTGEVRSTIERVALDSAMTGYAELVELQKDARRCIKQAEELRKVNPARAAAYDEQLVAALSTIDRQAETVSKKKAKP